MQKVFFKRKNCSPPPRFQRNGGFTSLEILKAEKKYRKKISLTGFTLIELLMVITIIALLAVVIISRVGTIKKKGNDAAVERSLEEVAKASEFYYSNNKTYEGVCNSANTTLSDSGDFGKIKDYINKNNGVGGIVGCKDDKEAYAVISSLNTKDCWCVDSEARSKKVDLGGASDCRARLSDTFCP